MISELFKLQSKSSTLLESSSVKERLEKLRKIHQWILNNRDQIKTALYNDFKKPFAETDLTEIYPVLTEIKHAKKNLMKWMRTRKVKKTLTLFTHSAYLEYKAKGTVLIIAPWNYPFLLTIAPLVSAIAAGNNVIIKPSEISNNTSKLLNDMINQLFTKEKVVVVQGDKNVVTELLQLPFDHIFFTGSTKVGKIVAKAAIENLSSFTLELGGKSPVIIDATANLNIAAEKIVWGKFLNKGQTCIAPDYLLVEKDIREIFVTKLIEQIRAIYGKSKNEIETSSCYARIINGHHHKRLVEIIDNAVLSGSEILYGGANNKEDKFIEPTIILTNCNNCKILEEEIFGPLLPIIEYTSIEEAIEWINFKPNPLALYIFSKNEDLINRITLSTQSGSVGINEVVLQFAHHFLPFGGVKESGVGKSHGYAGFKEFSNERSFIKSGKLNFLKMIYPPYTENKKKLIDLLVKYF